LFAHSGLEWVYTGYEERIVSEANVNDTDSTFDDGDASEPGEAPFADDREAEWLASNDTVTNDAVAGETVTRGVGNGNDGPTGGSPGEASPYYAENDLEGEPIDFSASEDSDASDLEADE
jgi:hypothetical protein